MPDRIRREGEFGKLTEWIAVAGAVLVSLGLLPGPTAGQEAAPPDSLPVVAIQAGRLIDAVDGRVRENVTILIRGEEIREVGPEVRIPPGAETIDLSTHTVMPGFMDMHTHLTGRGDRTAFRVWPGYEAIVGVANARKTLLAGFTTVRNVGGRGFADIALRDAIEDGVVPGPRMFTAGHSMGITGGHCDWNGNPPGVLEEPGIEEGIFNSADEARAAVNYQIKYGADLIKFCATGGVLSEGDAVGVQQPTFEMMQAVVETASLAERTVAAHAHGTEGIKAAVRAGVSSIEHGSMLDDEAVRLMEESGTYLVPTMMAFENVKRRALEGKLTGERGAKALEISPHYEKSIVRAIESDIRIAFGTDAGVYPHGENAREFRLLVDAGMPAMEAILAATREAARLLNRERRLGTIEPGKLADIVAVRGDPLENIDLLGEIDFVMKGGVVFKRDGRGTIPEWEPEPQ